MASKPKRSTLVNKLDKLVGERVKAIGKCERCGRGKNEVQLQTAHIYSRRYKHLRWELENLLCLCSGCHFWWHQNPAEAIIWAMDIRDLNKLKLLRQNVTPIKDWQLVELYKELDK